MKGKSPLPYLHQMADSLQKTLIDKDVILQILYQFEGLFSNVDHLKPLEGG